jgi:hypothetical protein
MHSPELKAFIRDHSALFWSIPENKKENISEAALVETILNYGDLDVVKKLFSLIGLKKTATIFFESLGQSERKRGNYHELTIHFFTLYFQRYAS